MRFVRRRETPTPPSTEISGRAACTDAPAIAGVGAQQNSVVSVHGLIKRFSTGSETVVALDGVDLTIQKGELVVLLGPSGCGKTTLLRSIAGLESPQEGTVTIAGEEVFDATKRRTVPPERRDLGMMFQSYALWPHMTVMENILYPIEARRGKGDHASTAAQTMELLGIGSLGGRYASELSGGQQQRVALARAMACEPSVILFDEPLSNVDAKVRRTLRGELRRVKEIGHLTGIYVTHDQEDAMELADRLAVMESGRIAQVGSPEDVYRRPTSQYVARFIGEANVVNATLQRSGETLVARTDLGTFPLETQDIDASVVNGHVMFRPENVTARADGASGGVAGSFAGKVQDVKYMGCRLEVVLDAAGQRILLWDDPKAADRYSNGEVVDLQVESADIVWLDR